MGDVSREREELKKAYPKSLTWGDKVKRMSDSQVIAIYSRLKSVRKLGK
jgi:hypothetical protein